MQILSISNEFPYDANGVPSVDFTLKRTGYKIYLQVEGVTELNIPVQTNQSTLYFQFLFCLEITFSIKKEELHLKNLSH